MDADKRLTSERLVSGTTVVNRTARPLTANCELQRDDGYRQFSSEENRPDNLSAVGRHRCGRPDLSSGVLLPRAHI